jgi:hypothetical protein
MGLHTSVLVRRSKQAPSFDHLVGALLQEPQRPNWVAGAPGFEPRNDAKTEGNDMSTANVALRAGVVLPGSSAWGDAGGSRSVESQAQKESPTEAGLR